MDCVRCAAGARNGNAGGAGSLPGAGPAISRRYRPGCAYAFRTRRGGLAAPSPYVFVRVLRRRRASSRRPGRSARRAARIAAARPLPSRMTATESLRLQTDVEYGGVTRAFLPDVEQQLPAPVAKQEVVAVGKPGRPARCVGRRRVDALAQRLVEIELGGELVARRRS